MTARIRVAFLIIIGLLVFMMARLAILFPWTPKRLVSKDELKPSELIVVLGGEYYERIDYAFELANHEYASMIYAPNIGYEKSKARIEENMKKADPDIRFYEGPGAASTYEEALATRSFVTEKHLTSLILVTSAYHSFRARWTFDIAMPETQILSAPLPADFSDKESKIYRYLRSEQLKFLGYYFYFCPRLWFRRITGNYLLPTPS